MARSIFPVQNERRGIPRQDQLDVVFGLQYAVLAKSVKGLNDKICAGVRGVMLSSVDWVFSTAGAALVIEANKETMK